MDVLLKLEEILLKIVTKVTSGKFVLTIIAGVVFYQCSINGKINDQAIVSICLAVFMSYFNKKKEGDKNGV